MARECVVEVVCRPGVGLVRFLWPPSPGCFSVGLAVSDGHGRVCRGAERLCDKEPCERAALPFL